MTNQFIVLQVSKTVLRNLSRNWLGYLLFAGLLYLFTPFTPQLNHWPVIKARLLTLVELPIKAIDIIMEHP